MMYRWLACAVSSSEKFFKCISELPTRSQIRRRIGKPISRVRFFQKPGRFIQYINLRHAICAHFLSSCRPGTASAPNIANA